MNKKLCTFLQNGRPLTAAQSGILEADPRVASYYTEAHSGEGRLISVRLAEGYNYEYRDGFIAWDWTEVKDMLSRVEDDDA